MKSYTRTLLMCICFIAKMGVASSLINLLWSGEGTGLWCLIIVTSTLFLFPRLLPLSSSLLTLSIDIKWCSINHIIQSSSSLSLSLSLCIIHYSIGWLVCSVFGLVWLRGWTVYIFWTVGPLLTTGNLLKQERIIQYIQKITHILAHA